MKKRWRVFIAMALCAAVACVLIFPYWGYFHRIHGDQVEKIVVWKGCSHVTVDTEDSERFIALYNASEYGGKATGEGGTPEFGVWVYYHDGKTLRADDFGCLGRDFEVSLSDGSIQGKAYYVDNEELYKFVLGLVEKYC